MTQFLIRRIFWAIFLFFVATIITYLIFWVIPSDPAALAAGKSATPADIARVSHFLHLDEPIWKQYLRFVWQLVRHGVARRVVREPPAACARSSARTLR